MNKLYFIFTIALLLSCTNNKEELIKNSKTKLDLVEREKLVLDSSNTKTLKSLNVLEDTVLNDTFFIYKKITKDYYHAVYIDSEKNPKIYNRLINFNELQQNTYDTLNKTSTDKNLLKSSTFITSGLPKNWLPLYQYKNNYFLYAPCDWGTAGRRVITDREFIYWDMMGLHSVSLISSNQPSDYTYEIITENMSREKSERTKIIIHIIDPDTKMAIFEFYDINTKKLYIPVESAARYGLIVNDCRNQKQFEYKFEEIDFSKLL